MNVHRYSSNLMRLAVYGRQSPLELERLVRAKFEGVKDLGLSPPEFSGVYIPPKYVDTRGSA